MIPSTHNLENQITKFEIEDEVKATKIKKKSYLTPVKIHEILKQNIDEHDGYVKGINVDNVNKDVTNAKEHEIYMPIENVNRMMIVKRNVKNLLWRFRRDKQPVLYPTKYWVQLNFDYKRGAGDSSSPLTYDSGSNSFVLLVFSLVAIMLAITAVFVGYVYYDEDLRERFEDAGPLIMIIGMVGLLCVNYSMMCSHCTRVPPCNIVVLILGVIFMSLIAAYITVRYRTDVIFVAAMATIIVVIVCMILACTSFDFTHYLLYVVAIGAAFMAVVLVVAIVQWVTDIRYKPLSLGILIVGTLLNVVMLIIELQMILGGKSVELNEDDYALGAFMLYTSIVDLFLKIIQLVGFMSLIAAFVTIKYRIDTILIAAGITLLVIIICMILACTSFDFTRYLLYVFVIGVALIALVVTVTVTQWLTKVTYEPLNLGILIGSTLLSVIIIVIELQMILGGRSVEINENDYALAAFMLYTSILDLFMKILEILNLLEDH